MLRLVEDTSLIHLLSLLCIVAICVRATALLVISAHKMTLGGAPYMEF